MKEISSKDLDTYLSTKYGRLWLLCPFMKKRCHPCLLWDTVNRNILLCWRKPTKTTFPINWIFGILLVPSSYVWHDGHSESYLVSVSVTIMMDHQPTLRQTQAGLWRRSRMEYPPTLSQCPPIITQISFDHFARNVSNISLESRATSQQPAGKGNICAYSQSFC